MSGITAIPLTLRGQIIPPNTCSYRNCQTKPRTPLTAKPRRVLATQDCNEGALDARVISSSLRSSLGTARSPARMSRNKELYMPLHPQQLLIAHLSGAVATSLTKRRRNPFRARHLTAGVKASTKPNSEPLTVAEHTGPPTPLIPAIPGAPSTRPRPKPLALRLEMYGRA